MMASKEINEIDFLIKKISPFTPANLEIAEAMWLSHGEKLIGYAEDEATAKIMVKKSILNVVLWNLDHFQSQKINEIALSLLANIGLHSNLRGTVAANRGFTKHVEQTLYSGHVTVMSHAFRLWRRLLQSIEYKIWTDTLLDPSNIQQIIDLLSDRRQPVLVQEVVYFLTCVCQTHAKHRVIRMLRNEVKTLVPEVLMDWLSKAIDNLQITYTVDGDVYDACSSLVMLLPIFEYTREDVSMNELFRHMTGLIESLRKFEASNFCFMITQTISSMIKEKPWLADEISECSVFLEGIIDLLRRARVNTSGRISLWGVIKNLFENTRNTQLGSVLNCKVNLLEEELIVFRFRTHPEERETKSVQEAATAIRGYLAVVSQYNTARLSCCINKYGVTNDFKVYNDEYTMCVYMVIYTLNEVPVEDHVENIIKTKNTLGIDDLEAAIMHLLIAGNLVRDIGTISDSLESLEKQLALKNLLFISNMVFGEKSSSLLLWRCVIDVTDSQVDEAVLGSAMMAYEFSLTSVGRDIDVEAFKKKQQLYKLSDEVAELLFRRHMQKLVAEENISAGHVEASAGHVEAGVDQC